MRNWTIDEQKVAAANMRKDILAMSLKAGAAGAHIGGSLSSADILCVLYSGILRQNKDDWDKRDRLIFSKGHCVMGQYAAMRQIGLISQNDLETYEDSNSWLFSHATRKLDYGIEFSTGSLGQGLSLGIGVALALKRKNSSSARVYVLMGDGECNEGQIWEAAMAAPHFKLDNICVIIDANGMQVDGRCSDVLNQEGIKEKWRAFGWQVREIDGHDLAAINAALKKPVSAPLAVIARTIKGKGISFMENSSAWHHGRLGRKQYEQALLELENNPS